MVLASFKTDISCTNGDRSIIDRISFLEIQVLQKLNPLYAQILGCYITYKGKMIYELTTIRDNKKTQFAKKITKDCIYVV